MPPKPSNRRSEARISLRGTVVLSLDDPLHRDIPALLVDTSKSGFRAAYDYPALSFGQVVTFQHVAAQGNARVMWTRIVGVTIESGFAVIS